MKLAMSTIRYYMGVQGFASDADLAKAAGWSKAKTSRVLSGKQGVGSVIVQQLARALRCKESEIVELDDVAQTPFQRAVLAALKHADPNIKSALHSILKIPSDIHPDD